VSRAVSITDVTCGAGETFTPFHHDMKPANMQASFMMLSEVCSR